MSSSIKYFGIFVFLTSSFFALANTTAATNYLETVNTSSKKIDPYLLKIIKDATNAHPNLKSLSSAIDYIKSKYSNKNYYFPAIALRKIAEGSLTNIPIKKITIGEACGIASIVRMYLYYANESTGMESYAYRAKAFADAQRILLDVQEIEEISKSFAQVKDIQDFQKLRGVDETGNMIFNMSAENCSEDPFSNISSLPNLILNNSVDFSDTKVHYSR